jgi:hypothetical protein
VTDLLGLGSDDGEFTFAAFPDEYYELNVVTDIVTEIIGVPCTKRGGRNSAAQAGRRCILA